MGYAGHQPLGHREDPFRGRQPANGFVDEFRCEGHRAAAALVGAAMYVDGAHQIRHGIRTVDGIRRSF